MNILHISKYYHPYIGGVESICQYLVENRKSGDNVAVVCFTEQRNDIVDEVNGVRIYRVGTWVNISRQALSLSYRKVLKKAIKETCPDIIHFHWADPFPAAVLLSVIPKDVKLVIHWHMDIVNQKLLYALIKPVETAFLKRADRIFVTSPIYRDHSLPLQPFLSKVDVVTNAINESRLILKEGDEEKIKSLKQHWGNKDIVFFVGRHTKVKGLNYLLEAEQLVKSDCVFLIAGEGPVTEELKASCKSDRVHFLGWISDDELRQYLYAAKVFAFPSITKNEAFGVALAEAMYCHTPAVTFHIEGSGVNWVSLKDETGLEVENSNAAEYAKAIDRLLTDEALYNRLADNGVKRVKENFLIKNMVDACYESYGKIMTTQG